MPYIDWSSNRCRGQHSNGGFEDFKLDIGGWETPYDANFNTIKIDETTQSVSINILDDRDFSGSGGRHDGNNTVVLTINDPNTTIGFDKEVYVFTEEEAKNLGGSVVQQISLQSNSNIKAVTIIIEDNDPGTDYNLSPIKGTASPDQLFGTEKGDAIYGYDGNDILLGLEGSDSLYGYGGNDTLLGGNERDFLYGLSGDDKLYGEADNDTLDGGEGNDFLDGGDADDNLFGWNGNDTLIGGSGNDSIYGEAGHDILQGDDGNDTLIGGLGNDILTGGTGGDTFVFNSLSQGIDLITDFNYSQSDKIQISQTGFGATSTNQFTYDSSTGALSFNSIQFASLQPNLTFVPSLDIILA
ncbi:hypothetical protein NUACC21_59090 [Scytonema sp. NUACC21]